MKWGDPGQGSMARRGLLERGPAGHRAEGPWVRWGEAPLAPMPPCQFGEGIKNFLFNYFFLENY